MLSLHTTIMWNSLNPGRVTGNVSMHLYRVVLCLTLSFPLRSPTVGLVSVIIRWQNKYWYFPTNTKILRLGTLLKGSALARPASTESWVPDPASQNEEKATQMQWVFSIIFVFQGFCSFKTCLPLGRTRPAPASCPGGARSQLAAERAPRSCAPCRRGPGVPAT